MDDGAAAFNYIVHKLDKKDLEPDQILRFTKNGCEVWLVEGRESQFADPEMGIAALTPSLPASRLQSEKLVAIRRFSGKTLKITKVKRYLMQSKTNFA